MGRKTWDSLPDKVKPLPNRINYVLTRNTDIQFTNNFSNKYKNVILINDLSFLLDMLYKSNCPDLNIWIIGGSSLYNEAINHPYCSEIYTTEIYNESECDVYFPKIDRHIYNISNVSSFKL